MPDSEHTQEQLSYTCGNCGKEAALDAQAPEPKCPSCGSSLTTAMLRVGETLGYALADRSRGPSIEDGRLGRMAYFAGWMSSAEVKECLHSQKESIQRGTLPHPKFGEVAVAEGYLTEAQVKALLRIQGIHRHTTNEQSFGAIAVEMGFVTPEQLEECLAEQKRLLHATRQSPRIGLIMTEKRLLTTGQVKQILEEQARRGDGALVELTQEVVSQQAESVKGAEQARKLAAAAPVALLKGQVACRCDDCGYTDAREDWNAGTVCPMCQSKNFLPVPIIDKAFGYSLADRRFGPAPEDGRLGMMCYFAGYMTLDQVQTVLRRQSAAVRMGGKTPRFGSIAVQAGYLTESDVNRLLHMQVICRPSRNEETFGSIAVRKGYITQDQLDLCLEEQWKQLVERHEAPLLGLLLIEKKFLTTSKVKAILRFQALYGQGPLYMPEDGSPERQLAAMPTERRRAPPMLKKLIAGVAMMILAGAGMKTGWFGVFSFDSGKTVVGCLQCNAVFDVPGSSDISCPHCKGNRTVCPLAVCPNCSTTFPYGAMGAGSRCPTCGNSKVLPHRKVDDAKRQWEGTRKSPPKIKKSKE